MKIRALSALAAVLILISIFVLWHGEGLYWVSIALGTLCMFEYSRLTLGHLEAPQHIRISFLTLCFCFLIISARFEVLTVPVLVVAAVLFVVMVLITINKSSDLDLAIRWQNSGLMGFVYVGLFPLLVIRLLALENGDRWLLGLLGIVFAGDTMAYLVGSRFGKTKLLESVSPKKTYEGAVGGLFGSALIGAAMAQWFLPGYPIWTLVILALVTGAFAQAGDFFESLLKRVADVKDSGNIMPGHGGMLDRLDGVLFAAPIYYVLLRALL